MQKFLSVGKDTITHHSFWPVEDQEKPDKIKPLGGLWFTLFDPSCPKYNEWVDYIIENPYILFYKYLKSGHVPCSVVTLKENSKIFILKTPDDLNLLKAKYPHNIQLFSYELLSKDYDGIWVDYYYLMNSNLDGKVKNILENFSVRTLIIFNLNVIEYYQSAKLYLPDLDYYGNNNTEVMEMYEIVTSDTKKKVDENNSLEYERLIEYLFITLKNYFNNYKINYFNIDKQELMRMISALLRKWADNVEINPEKYELDTPDLMLSLTKKLYQKNT